MKSRIVYGPIHSRRLGRLLGINVIKNAGSKRTATMTAFTASSETLR